MRIIHKVCQEIEMGPIMGPIKPSGGKLPQAPRAKKVLKCAVEEADNLDSRTIKPVHILLGLIREKDGVAALALSDLDITLEQVRSFESPQKAHA